MDNERINNIHGSDVIYTAYSRLADHVPAFPLTVDEWRRHHGAYAVDGITDAFRNQIGRRWSGLDAVDEVRKAVLTIAGLHLVGLDWKEASGWCNRVALEDREGTARGLVPALSDEDAAAVAAAVEDVAKDHRYATTVLFEVVARAREKSGWLPASAFLWTQKYDRALWLTIDSVGRPSMLPETAAIVSHWKDEKIMARPLDAIHLDVLVGSVLDDAKAHDAA
jgi:hypothetical protein